MAHMLMTDGVQVVVVVRSAFTNVWSKRGWSEAPEGAEPTPLVLDLPQGKSLQDWKAEQDQAAQPDAAAPAAESAPPAAGTPAEPDDAVAA